MSTHLCTFFHLELSKRPEMFCANGVTSDGLLGSFGWGLVTKRPHRSENSSVLILHDNYMYVMKAP